MRENHNPQQGQNKSTNSAANRPALQVIDGKRKIVGSSVCINQYVKRCIHRLVFQSDLEISSLRQVAKLAGVTGPRSEAKILDVLRETVREAMHRPDPTTPPASYPTNYRRVA